MTRRVYIFDIDGTLADCSHRLHLLDKTPEKPKRDYRAFYAACVDDEPIEHMLDLCVDLYDSTYGDVIYVSGRSDEVRVETLNWLRAQGLLVHNDDLYMRREGDYREDSIVKKEILDHLRASGIEPIMVFDDRKRVVDMWRANGIPCAQVAEGDF